MTLNLTGKLDALGDHFIIGLSGTTLSAEDKNILRKLRPLGILLLSRNFNQHASYGQWIKEYRHLLSEATKYSERQTLLVSIDHEGGRVHRTPAPLTNFPAPALYADTCKEVAQAMAKELLSIGVHISLGPLADLHTNKNNPVIGARAFSGEPQDVIASCRSFIDGLAPILPCLKHFPGHGDTTVDSHFALPTQSQTLEELRTRELLPFKELAPTLPLLLTAHIQFPRIDSVPATLSHTLLQGVLRDELGFSGCIISDDIDMLAVSKMYELEETIAATFSASLDIMIVSRHKEPTSERPLALAEMIYRCLSNRATSKTALSEETLLRSHLRVKDLLQKIPLVLPPHELTKEVFESNQALARSLPKE